MAATDDQDGNEPTGRQVVPMDINELENAIEYLEGMDPEFCEEPTFIFLSRATGELKWVEEEEEADVLLEDEDYLEIPGDLFEDEGYRIMADFVHSLGDHPRQGELAQAISGGGAFRRFKGIVFGSGDVELKYAWNWFETRRKRELISDWLETRGIEPKWNCDIFAQPSLPDKRPELLEAVLCFVRAARELPAVRRIALLGSLTTDKAIPKDVDLLVEVADDEPLGELAKLRRQLSGRTMSTGDNCGADVFLCNPRGDYIGRVCEWKKCAPGVRRSCEAQHCGRREYVYDDLHNVTLDRAVVASPPVDLWPEQRARVDVPADVRRMLLDELG